MNVIIFIELILTYILYKVNNINASLCGCITARTCYEDMVYALKHGDEASCVTDAGVSTSMLTIYLTALKKFCPDLIEIHYDKRSFQQRSLYEVIIKSPKKDNDGKVDDRPVIIIDAGQEADKESIGLALWVIEQLLACQENEEMISKVRWVILPCTNPDGLEYTLREDSLPWTKNMRSLNSACFGVDISRNFPGVWKTCPAINNYCSQLYPGPNPASENETMFIMDVLTKYKKDAKVYLSMRKDGHSLNYPSGYDRSESPWRQQINQAAAVVTSKINQRAGSLHLFTNQSIYEANGRPICGHSVDYALKQLNFIYPFEMRVFLGSNNRLMTKFQTLPRGYEITLRNGYGSGIKEFYNIIVKEQQLKQP